METLAIEQRRHSIRNNATRERGQTEAEMFKLIQRPRLAPTPEPTPREKLATHLQNFDAIRAKIAELSAIVEKASSAENREAQAQLEVDRISEREDEALAEWSRDPTRQPPSFAEERAAATAALISVQAEAVSARKRLEIISPRMAQLQQDYTDSITARHALIRDVLVDEAHRLFDEYFEIMKKGRAYDALLRGIMDHLRSQPLLLGEPEVRKILAGTTSHKEELNRISATHRVKGREFANSLADDAAATLEIDL